MLSIKKLSVSGYEQVVRFEDEEANLSCIIAVHSTALGPALGGVRFWQYACEEDALCDVLRLSRAMTFKNAAAGLELGGGKAVIMAKPGQVKDELLLQAFARCVDYLQGAYITAEDMGMTDQDMAVIQSVTPHVGGLPSEVGGLGDPSWYTAKGVFAGMRAGAQQCWGDDSLQGKRVAVQGAGHVAVHLVKMLVESGALVTLCDYFEDKAVALAQEHGVDWVPYQQIYTVPMDVFSPCAMGAVLQEEVVAQLSAQVIAGCANNQLASEDIMAQIQDQGIVYAPDFLINAGGVIVIFAELTKQGADWAKAKVDGLYELTLEVLQESQAQGRDSVSVAEALADERIRQVTTG